MKKQVVKIIIAAIVYLALYPLASSAGLIHPACYAYVGTLLPLLFALGFTLMMALDVALG